MDFRSSPSSNNPWFAALEDVDDPMLLQVFLGDCLVDYPPKDMDMGALMDDNELNCTASPRSECNSSTAAGEISNVDAKRRKKAEQYPTSPNNNTNAESNEHSSVQHNNCLSPDNTEPPTPIVADAKRTKRPRRLPDQSQTHVLAERKRRQILSQRFIALTALIPDLKKLDKTSVLGEAITHMKHLKERVKILEEEKAKRAAESVVVVQRSRLVVENESKSSRSNDSSHSSGIIHDDQFPEVQVRFSNRSVLIKVHFPLQTGLLSKIINKLENIRLLVTNTCSMPFNNTTVDITIMAQMAPDFDMGPQEVVEIIRSIF